MGFLQKGILYLPLIKRNNDEAIRIKQFLSQKNDVIFHIYFLSDLMCTIVNRTLPTLQVTWNYAYSPLKES